jgi:hypothetical protein
VTTLRQMIARLGVPGVLALGVLLFCALFYYSGVQPLERELQLQQTASERQRARSPAQLASSDDRSEDVRRFQNLFPTMDQLPAELERVYGFARAAKLQMQQAEYRLEAGRGGLLAYRVTFPIRGSYAQIRKFVGEMLQEMSMLSLDTLRFERKRVGDTQLEAQVRLTLHFRPDGEESLRTTAVSEESR